MYLREGGVFTAHLNRYLTEICVFEVRVFEGGVQDFEIGIIEVVFDRNTFWHFDSDQRV